VLPFESGGKTIPDFTPINGRFAVCREVYELIDSLEPGRHQFVPVRIILGNLKPIISRTCDPAAPGIQARAVITLKPPGFRASRNSPDIRW
jgi:hypothetical protein